MKAEVEFIDYGNKEIVDRKSLILAVNVDENLAYVPPQVNRKLQLGRSSKEILNELKANAMKLYVFVI